MKTNESKAYENKKLTDIYGPLVGGKDLMRLLGFKTSAAFRRAARMNKLGIHTFEIEGRRGKFAFTDEVECWLATLKNNQGDNMK